MFAATQAAAAPVIALQQPAAWLVFDLETGDAPEEAVTAALEAWKPGPAAKTAEEINAEADHAATTWTPPSNIKDPAKIEERRNSALEKIETDRVAALVKIEERRAEATARIREKAALLDASPILCVALKTDRLNIVLNGMNSDPPAIEGCDVWPCQNERGLLLALRVLLDENTTPQTVIVGHNVRNFDLPKLRQAFIRHGLKLPEILKPRLRDEERAEVVDTAFLFKSFSMEHRDDFCSSLDTVAATLGIPRPKGVISGADVPRLHRAGEYAAILTYCAVDCACTARAYQLMTSTAPDLM
jgi:hypothetical protein